MGREYEGHLAVTWSSLHKNGNKKIPQDLESSFRGRPLNGKVMEVPSGYTGTGNVFNRMHHNRLKLVMGDTFLNKFVLQNRSTYGLTKLSAYLVRNIILASIILKEIRRPFNEEEDRNLTITHKFKNFNYWNLDRKPSADDRLHQALEWVHLAKVLHQPVSLDDSQRFAMDSQNSVIDK